MASRPSLSDHPQRDKIIEALIAGQTPDAVAQWCKPPLHKTTIWRFRRSHIASKLSRIEETAKALQDNILQSAAGNQTVDPAVIQAATSALCTADPIMSRVLAKYQRYDDMYAKTVDPQGFSSIDRAETQALTLHANLTGRLQQSGPSTVVQIVFGQFPQNTNKDACNRDATDCTDVAPGAVIDISPVR
jgi:hypothetical protein